MTGASAGLGAEFARQLALKGMNLILVARRSDRLEHLAAELGGGDGVQVRPVTADLSQPHFMESIRPVLRGVEVGLLINNAGFGLGGDFLAHDLERELELLAVNCRAPLIIAHVLGGEMARRKKGGIVFVGSTASFVAAPFLAHYSASKAYNLFLAEGLWYEMKQQGIDVLALCPGGTRTEFHEVAGIRPVSVMEPGPVVALALRRLGHGPSTVAGWRNRILLFLGKLSLRQINTRLAGVVMGKLRQR